MTELVFLLEELSASAMLDGLLPRLGLDLPPVRHVVFEGKNDLDRNVARRIRGYRNPHARFILVRDQDSAPDCVALKARLSGLCADAGRPDAVVRILCRELEALYIADLQAVETGLGMPGLARHQHKAKYRSPDALGSPARELRDLTGGRYQKVGGSRAIGVLLDVDNARSHSFSALVSAIRGACAQPCL